MSAQTTYNYFPQHGTPGGIVDVSPLAIDTRIVEENTGVVFPGMGVVTGTTPGVQIKLPVSADTAAKFEGITINRRTTERDLAGDLYIRNKSALGVVRWGRVYVAVEPSKAPAYNDALYLITDGTYAGYFTVAGSAATKIAINGRFLGAVDGNAAPVELYNGATTTAASAAAGLSLGELNDVDFSTPPTDGQVIKFDDASDTWKPAADNT